MKFQFLIIPLLVAALAIRYLMSHQLAGKLKDIPNDRSLHVAPIPRIGGAGLLAGVMAGWLLLYQALQWWLILPVLLLFAVSLLDDLHNLPVRLRLPAHALAALVLVAGSGLFGSSGILISVPVILAVIWMTNLFNFMDGSNGLAGGMAVSGFAVYAVAAWQAGRYELAWLNFSIVAAALPFLWLNFNPARIFLGDAGSIPLGFLVAALGLLGWQQSIWPAWFPLLVFSPFIVDATVTLARRTLRGAKITEAHREHYYQRLIQMGWSHRKLALAEYALMLASGVSALWLRQGGWPWALLVFWCALYAVLMLRADSRWKKFTQEQHVQK